MTASAARPPRSGARLLYLPERSVRGEDPAQVVRLDRFREAHKDVEIVPPDPWGACWCAIVRRRNGESFHARHSLPEILDVLQEELEPPGAG
jgi:hypothetical protein